MSAQVKRRRWKQVVAAIPVAPPQLVLKRSEVSLQSLYMAGSLVGYRLHIIERNGEVLVWRTA